MKKDLKYYLSLKYPHTVEEYEEDGKAYISLEIPELPGCGAWGETYGEALVRLNESKELWIEESLKRGLSVPEPVSEEDFSGKFLLRIPVLLHMGLAKQAKANKLSLNQYTKSILEKVSLLEEIKSYFQKRDKTLLQAINSQSEKIEKLESRIKSMEESSIIRRRFSENWPVSDSAVPLSMPSFGITYSNSFIENTDPTFITDS